MIELLSQIDPTSVNSIMFASLVAEGMGLIVVARYLQRMMQQRTNDLKERIRRLESYLKACHIERTELQQQIVSLMTESNKHIHDN